MARWPPRLPCYEALPANRVLASHRLVLYSQNRATQVRILPSAFFPASSRPVDLSLLRKQWLPGSDHTRLRNLQYGMTDE